MCTLTARSTPEPAAKPKHAQHQTRRCPISAGYDTTCHALQPAVPVREKGRQHAAQRGRAHQHASQGMHHSAAQGGAKLQPSTTSSNIYARCKHIREMYATRHVREMYAATPCCAAMQTAKHQPDQTPRLQERNSAARMDGFSAPCNVYFHQAAFSGHAQQKVLVGYPTSRHRRHCAACRAGVS